MPQLSKANKSIMISITQLIIYLLKVNNSNTRERYVNYVESYKYKHQNNKNDILVFLLTLNIFETFFLCL